MSSINVAFGILLLDLMGRQMVKVVNPETFDESINDYVDNLVAELRATKNAQSVSKFDFYFKDLRLGTRGNFMKSKIYEKSVSQEEMQSILETTQAIDGEIPMPDDELIDCFDVLKTCIYEIVSEPAFYDMDEDDKNDFISNVLSGHIGEIPDEYAMDAMDYLNEVLM